MESDKTDLSMIPIKDKDEELVPLNEQKCAKRFTLKLQYIGFLIVMLIIAVYILAPLVVYIYPPCRDLPKQDRGSVFNVTCIG